MKWNKLFKSLLKTTVYLLDQASDQMDRAADSAAEMRDSAHRVMDNVSSAVRPSEDHTLRHILSFAAGVGLGIGAGMLLAPTSGSELRDSIGDRVQDIRNGVRARVSGEGATGTD
jgi:hypothetical protein